MKPVLPLKPALLFVLACTLIMLGGCGYSSPYNTNNELNKSGNSVGLYLSMWDNKTNLLGFEATIQHDLILWLKKSNRFHLTQKKDEADYILDGTIYSINQPALSYGTFDRATVIRAEVEFAYVLTNLETGKVVFRQARLLKRQNYNVGGDAIRTNSNLQKSLKIMSEDLADSIYIQLFYLFTLDTSKGNRIIIPADDI